MTIDSYQEKQALWQLNKSISYALDFLGTALVANDLNNSEAIRACKFILSNRSKTSKLGLDIALSFANRVKQRAAGKDELVIYEPINKAQVEISFLRHYVSAYPNNPIAWVDLAFYYTLLALKGKAARCIDIALALAPENRFVLRSAARFRLHIGEPDKVMYCLRRASSTPQDPWLLATEISMCEVVGKKSKFVKTSKVISNDSNFHPHDRSELCAALATLEFNHGAVRKARKLFECSLIAPNENTIAQFEWIQPKTQMKLESRHIQVPALFEADTRQFMREGQFDASFAKANSWQEFQPFSSIPGALGSYMAMLGMRDDSKALELIKKAVISSPNDTMLRNNKACALASLDRPVEAKNVLRSIDIEHMPAREKGTLLATQGLIEFRIGNIEAGRSYYERASLLFKKEKDLASLSVCNLYRGREEERLNSGLDNQYLYEALRLAQQLDQKEVIRYVEYIIEHRKKNGDEGGTFVKY
jgi:Tfp pilus assembly protein PilF